MLLSIWSCEYVARDAQSATATNRVWEEDISLELSCGRTGAGVGFEAQDLELCQLKKKHDGSAQINHCPLIMERYLLPSTSTVSSCSFGPDSTRILSRQ